MLFKVEKEVGGERKLIQPLEIMPLALFVW